MKPDWQHRYRAAASLDMAADLLLRSGGRAPVTFTTPQRPDEEEELTAMSIDARHSLMRSLSIVFSLVLIVVACTAPGESPAATGTPGAPGTPAAGTPPAGSPVAGRLFMLSTQFEPIAEAEGMRNTILADFEGDVDFQPQLGGPFTDALVAQHQAGSGQIDIAGGLHGDFAAFEPEVFADLSDLAGEAADLGIPERFLELGRLGTDRQIYIPWMQATYIMAARSEALEHLPEGADINSLTWEQVTEWGSNITEATGEQRLGFPARLGEPGGLIHRFFQGYAYPSFTGGVNTTFRSPEALEMWQWLQDTWQYVNPQATSYSHMQEPLQTGEVWVAWDHTSRLIEALRADPENMVAFPSPSGPAGLGFMPVLAGLAIPETAPNPEGARDLIRYLLRPETQVVTLQTNAFFPVVGGTDPGELEPAIQMELDAVAAQSGADNTVPSLLPVGLGELGGEYTKVFHDTFNGIILSGGDPAEVLEQQAQNLQSVLDRAEAECWPPDPASEGVCQVE
jgi:multiple sugar transport system substrate-binding protein